MQTLFHLYAVNRDGFRVTPKETETDRERAERIISARNGLDPIVSGVRWVAIEVERCSGRMVGHRATAA